MKVFIFEDDMVTLFVRPKEQAWDYKSIIEVPDDLIYKYRSAEAKFSEVQKELRKVREGE